MGKVYIHLAPPKGCGGCLFKSNNCCDFIGYTGRARMLICKPGKDCTVKATTRARRDEIIAQYGKADYGWGRENAAKGGAAAKEKRSVGRPLKFDQMKAWELYERERLNDKALAAAMGVSRNGIRSWRIRNNYPANVENNNKPVDRAPTLPPGVSI